MSSVRPQGSAPKLPPIGVGAATEIGQREQNQDSMSGFVSPVGTVYVVADGMGGYRGGAEASRMVVEAINRHLLTTPASTPVRDALTMAVRLANVEVLEKGKSGDPESAGMGSTVAIALVRATPTGAELVTAHVGDSRVYLHRAGRLQQLTRDHTQVQWLIDSQAIDEATARTHPDASILTRAIGHTTALDVDCSDPIPLHEGDGVLLCSDGLSGFASTDDITRVVQASPDPTACAADLIRLALASGSNDNITVQLLRVGRASAPVVVPPAARAASDATPSPAALPSLLQRHWPIGVGLFALMLAAGAWKLWPPPAPPAEDTRATTAAVSDALARMRTRIDALRKAAKADQEAVDADLKELASVGSADRKTLQTNLSGLSKSYDGLMSRSASLRSEADKLKAPEAKKDERPGELRKRLDAVTAGLKKLEPQVASAEEQLGQNQKRRAELHAELDASRAKNKPPRSRTAGGAQTAAPSETSEPAAPGPAQ